MSTLQRSALSARIAKLPELPPGIEPTVAPQSNYDDEDDVEEEEEDETDGLGALPSTMAPPNQYIYQLFSRRTSANKFEIILFPTDQTQRTSF
jgi:hypothetical protein